MRVVINPLTGALDFVGDDGGGGGGTVTTLTEGVGINLTPNPIILAGVIDLDINALITESSLAAGDLFAFVDVSVGTTPAAQRKVTFANLATAVGTTINPTLDHGLLLGLADDDHLQYLLLAGRSGGQTAIGGTGASELLQLVGTSNAARGGVVVNDVTFTHSSGTFGSFRIPMSPTIGSTFNAIEIGQNAGTQRTWAISTSPVGRALIFNPSIRNQTAGSAVGLGAWLLFANTGFFRSNNTTGETMSEMRTFADSPAFGVITGGTLTVASLTTLDCRPTINTGATITTRRGVRFLNFGSTVGAGAQTDVIGFDYEAQTAGGLNIAFRNQDSAASIRSAGAAIFGANEAPVATLSVGAGSLFRVAGADGDLERIKNVAYDWPAANASGVLTNNGSGTLSWNATGSGIDHGGLTGLGDDDHLQYLLLAGRAGTANDAALTTSVGGTGTFVGGTDVGATLRLRASSSGSAHTGALTLDDRVLLWPTMPAVGAATTVRVVDHAPAYTQDSASTVISLDYRPTVTVSGGNPSHTVFHAAAAYVGSGGAGAFRAFDSHLTQTGSSTPGGGLPFSIAKPIEERSVHQAVQTEQVLSALYSITSLPTVEVTGANAGASMIVGSVYNFVCGPTGFLTATAGQSVEVTDYYPIVMLPVNQSGPGTSTIENLVLLAAESMVPVGTAENISLEIPDGFEMQHGGPGVFGTMGSPTNASVGLEVQSTTRAFLSSRMTTAEKTTLTGVAVADGMQLYDSTLTKMQFRENGAWVSFLTATEADALFLTPAEGNAAYQPLDADLTEYAALATTGLVVRTGAGTATTRSLAVTDSSSVDFTLTNADGVSGNPTITAAVLPAGVDHNSLANLATGDVHTQYLLLAGRAGTANDPLLSTGATGTISGSDDSAGNIVVQSTTNATKGFVTTVGRLRLHYGTFTAANGNNDDVAMTGLSFVRVTGPTLAYAIRSIAGGGAGAFLSIFNATTQIMTISHTAGSATGTAGMRIVTNTGLDVATVGVGMATLAYDTAADAGNGAWVLIAFLA